MACFKFMNPENVRLLEQHPLHARQMALESSQSRLVLPL
jgi:hypothetical protein